MPGRAPRMLLAAAAGLFWAAPVSAQTRVAVRAMPVLGNAPQVCTLAGARLNAGQVVNIAGTDGDTLRIIQLTDSTTLGARAASVTVAFSGVCNFPHRVRLESQNNGLFPVDGRITGSTPAFTSAVPYRATLAWGNATTSLDANAKLRQLAQQLITLGEPVAGDLTLRIEIQQGASNVAVGAPLLAGTYADTIRIYLEPQ